MTEAQTNWPETRAPNLANEIRYRRSRMTRRTGSLVFDRHLDAALAAPDGHHTPSPPR